MVVMSIPLCNQPHHHMNIIRKVTAIYLSSETQKRERSSWRKTKYNGMGGVVIIGSFRRVQYTIKHYM